MNRPAAQLRLKWHLKPIRVSWLLCSAVHLLHVLTGIRSLAIPHANVLGLILFFKKNHLVRQSLKTSHLSPTCHVRNGSHVGCMLARTTGEGAMGLSVPKEIPPGPGECLSLGVEAPKTQAVSRLTLGIKKPGYGMSYPAPLHRGEQENRMATSSREVQAVSA